MHSRSLPTLHAQHGSHCHVFWTLSTILRLCKSWLRVLGAMVQCKNQQGALIGAWKCNFTPFKELITNGPTDQRVATDQLTDQQTVQQTDRPTDQQRRTWGVISNLHFPCILVAPWPSKHSNPSLILSKYHKTSRFLGSSFFIVHLARWYQFRPNFTLILLCPN